MFRRKEGFTLIELLVVILIIAILVAIALPIYLQTQANAKKRTCQDNLRTIDGMDTAFFTDNSKWPSTGVAGLQDLLSSGYLKKIPICPSGAGAYQLVLVNGSAGSMMNASCTVAADHTL